MGKKYPCPCCNFLTFDESTPGTDEMCPVCGWEDDEIQFNNPLSPEGMNTMSLAQAKNNYNKYGAASLELLAEVRKPYQDEIPFPR